MGICPILGDLIMMGVPLNAISTGYDRRDIGGTPLDALFNEASRHKSRL